MVLGVLGPYCPVMPEYHHPDIDPGLRWKMPVTIKVPAYLVYALSEGRVNIDKVCLMALEDEYDRLEAKRIDTGRG